MDVSKTVEEEKAPYRKHPITVEEYHGMWEANAFGENARIELINGEIHVMSPFDSQHADCVDRLKDWFLSHYHQKAVIRARHPIILDGYSEPEPDLILNKQKVRIRA